MRKKEYVSPYKRKMSTNSINLLASYIFLRSILPYNKKARSFIFWQNSSPGFPS